MTAYNLCAIDNCFCVWLLMTDTSFFYKNENQKGRRERKKNHVDKIYWWISDQHTHIPILHVTTIELITAIIPSCIHQKR